MSDYINHVKSLSEVGPSGELPAPVIKPQEKETSDMHPDPAAAAPAMLGEEDTTQAMENDAEVAPRVKKRKCAIFVVYLGHKYQGMQRNPGAKTIEDELFQAMCKAGAISEKTAAEEKAFQKINWSRAARTDKGVSAICQVVSTNFIPLEGIVEEVNGHLPDDIRILGYQRTVKGFDARKSCDRRRYEYILPEWMFDPSFQPTSREQMTGLSPEQFIARRNPTYRFDEADMVKINGILAQYEGTHNFHNYTVRVNASEPQAKRYMLSFTCEGVAEIKGQRWVRMEVVGQSFMLHQIRKMIGMAVAVFRDMVPDTALRHALRSREREGVPMAPDLGLFLDRCYFESYNANWGQSRGCLDSDLSFGYQIQAFKHERLYPSLVDRDQVEQCNATWIQDLYAKRVRYFSRYPGFVEQAWDIVPQPECAKVEDGHADVSGEMNACADNPDGVQHNNDSKRPRPAPVNDVPRMQPPKANKRPMMDISAEYSD